MSDSLHEFDLPKLRDKVAGQSGNGMWRSLDELAQTPDFRAALEREFPSAITDFDEGGTSRRTFLQLMAASMALAGMYGCSERPSGKILPYVRQPEQIVPGTPLFFATTMPLNGYGYGVLAESHEGRPTKIEGNPDHPASFGASNALMQASVLQLYDPDAIRIRNVTRAGVISTWQAYEKALRTRLDRKREAQGKGIRLLTGTVTSPTFASQIKQFLLQFPQAKWHHYDALARVNSQKGAILAFGRPLNTVYRFRRWDAPEKPVDAKVIVSLDSDFLWEDPGSLQYARHFSAARKVRVRHSWQTTMSRLYVVESSFSITGSMADHRIAARPGEVADFARAIAARLGVITGPKDVPPKWAGQLDAIISDLQQHKGESIVIAGESQPPEIHHLCHAINAALENVGKTVYYTEAVEHFPVNGDGKVITAIDSLRQLTADMNDGSVDTLLILASNPAYTAPADLKFADALFQLSQPQIPGSAEYNTFTAYLGLYSDETAYPCQWQLPQAHYLESWGDVRAFDGTASVIQPLIEPMYQGRTAIEILSTALVSPGSHSVRMGYEIVRDYWQTQVRSNFDMWWATTLEKGVIAGSQFSAIPSELIAPNSPKPQPMTRPTAENEFDIVLRPDPSIWDGSFSNSGWLQECPNFLTKLVWDNAALISPKTAENLQSRFGEIKDGRVFRFTSPNRLRVEAPVMVLPGLPENCITMHFGYGRKRGGAASMEPDGTSPRGFDAYRLRHSSSQWNCSGVKLEPTSGTHRLVVTHNHHAMEVLPKFGAPTMQGGLKPQVVEHPIDDEQGAAEQEINNRKLIRTATLAYFNADPKNRHFVKELGAEGEKTPLLSLYPDNAWDYSKGYQWGMSIDTQSCMGCNACLVACVAENNISVVGKDEVAREREMHWIRIDQYFADDLDNPKVYHQPVPCMHCENAPCELVCPVGATVHSSEGLNQMVYNRCVGTRYCSNNCPYKVRRFNFFNWNAGSLPQADLQHNPEVTVRSRGVMEKCTYCVQRLQRTRIEIEKMIVRSEEIIAKLTEEKKTAPADGQQMLGHTIAELTRDRHNKEFETLERLQTACQQACPTQAISFGNLLPVTVINDNGQAEKRISAVKKLKEEPLDYPLLAELTTKPRTTYMARLRNPNPDLEPNAKS